VRRFGADFALDPHVRGYFRDEMGRGGDLGLLALRDFEPGAGERRLDLCTGHALGFHDAVFQSLRCRGLILAETAALRNRNHYCRRPDEEKPGERRKGYSVRLEGAKYGVSFGSALAIAISYTNNHSILWAIIHGIFSWLYVVYFALVYG